MTPLSSYDYKNSKSNGQCDCHKLSEFDTYYPSETSMMDLFAKILKGLQPLTIFVKQLHHRCSAGF